MSSSSSHIVDVLIAERAPRLTRSAAWPLLRPALYGLLDYAKARRMADAIGPMGGRQALDHVSDLLDRHEIGWHVAHGDVEGMVRAIEQIRRTPAETMNRMGQTARRVLQADMGQAILCGRFCDHLERVFHPRGAPVAPADERNVSCAR